MPNGSFQCCICANKHGERVFISHAREDGLLANQIATTCCHAGAAPFLFEREPSALAGQPIADKISSEVLKSRVQFVLLGPKVSNRYWTQAWIGFEIGVSRGADIGKYKIEHREYFSRRIIVVQDIKQSKKVCIPYMHVLLLLDYRNRKRWQQLEKLVIFLSDTATSTLDFFKAGNQFRWEILATTSKVNCSKSCGAAPYEVLVFKKDVRRLRCAKVDPSDKKVVAQIICPSCQTKVKIELIPAL